MDEFEIESQQADERYEAIDDFTDTIVQNVKRMIDKKGGNGELAIDYLSHREVIGELMEALMIAMPSDYGVKTK